MMDQLWTFEIDEEVGLEMESRIMKLIARDKRHKFVSFIKSQLGKKNSDNSNSALCPSQLLVWVCHCRAVKCAAALVSGATGQTVDLNVPLRDGLFPLHHAARSFSPLLVDLFLQSGAQADLRCNVSGHTFYGFLPLNVAIGSLGYQIDWIPKQSIFKLVFTLCGREMKEPLETIRMLAMKTTESQEVIYHYAKEGKLIELAILLMVAFEKIIPPPIGYEPDEVSKGGSRALHRYVASGIALQIDEEQRLRGSKNRKLVQMCQENKRVMKSMMLLLEIFQRAGYDMALYINLFGYDFFGPDSTAKHIAHLLRRKGFTSTGMDSYFLKEEKNNSFGKPRKQKPQPKDLHSQSHMRPNKSSVQDSRHSGIQKPMVKMPIEQQRSITAHFMHERRGLSSSAVQSFHTLRSFKANFCSDLCKTVKAQVKKTTKSVEQHVPNILSSKKCASLALAIKRGVMRV